MYVCLCVGLCLFTCVRVRVFTGHSLGCYPPPPPPPVRACLDMPLVDKRHIEIVCVNKGWGREKLWCNSICSWVLAIILCSHRPTCTVPINIWHPGPVWMWWPLTHSETLPLSPRFLLTTNRLFTSPLRLCLSSFVCVHYSFTHAKCSDRWG